MTQSLKRYETALSDHAHDAALYRGSRRGWQARAWMRAELERLDADELRRIRRSTAGLGPGGHAAAEILHDGCGAELWRRGEPLE